MMEEEKEIARRIEITRRHAANGFRWLQQPDAIVILRLAYFLLFFFPPPSSSVFIRRFGGNLYADLTADIKMQVVHACASAG